MIRKGLGSYLYNSQTLTPTRKTASIGAFSMKEIKGELWDFYGKPGCVVCITTNGTIKKDGTIVMGRGCAREAKDRDPLLPFTLGWHVKETGNKPLLIVVSGTSNGLVCSFPVKHNWWEQADLSLIKESAHRLMDIIESSPEPRTFILPRPGCGNGKLTWEQVKPVLEFLPDNVWVISK